MKKIYIAILLFILLGAFGYSIFQKNKEKEEVKIENIPEPKIEKIEEKIEDDSSKSNNIENEIQNKIVPLERAGERITKKKFGDFITTQNSPVRPERFSGYHTGTDFETFDSEKDVDIPVRAICDGQLATKRTASGYGGLAVMKCELKGEKVSVIYGHLDIKSVKNNIGDDIKTGDIIGMLGEGNSSETDYERKHLHLGIHKGNDINLLGYVQEEGELSSWMNPCLYICEK